MSQKHRTDDSGSSRRDFLKTGVAAAVGVAAGTQLRGAASAETAPAPGPPYNPRTHQAMPTRNLGRTGYRTGIFSLGGQATIEKPNQWDAAAAIVHRAIDLGVNYIDTAAAYGGAEQWSQKYIGTVMKSRRNEVFLATKSHKRTYDESMQLLESSLKQLQTDRIDLWQLHNITRMEQLDQIFGPGGAIHAFEKARAEGIVRFLGITGHADPFVLAEGLRRYRFDTILLAVNAADKHHLSFIDYLMPLALEQQLGIIGMKIPARGRILAGWTPPPPDQQPTFGKADRPGTLTIREAFQYVYSLPVSTVIVGCDTVAQLEENLTIAREFVPLNDGQMRELVAKTEPVKRQALFFRKWDT